MSQICTIDRSLDPTGRILLPDARSCYGETDRSSFHFSSKLLRSHRPTRRTLWRQSRRCNQTDGKQVAFSGHARDRLIISAALLRILTLPLHKGYRSHLSIWVDLRISYGDSLVLLCVAPLRPVTAASPQCSGAVPCILPQCCRSSSLAFCSGRGVWRDSVGGVGLSQQPKRLFATPNQTTAT